MEKDFLDILKGHLLKEESILWFGKSDISKIFTWRDIYLIPISIIFGIGTLIWELSSIGVMTGSMKAKDATPVMGMVFALIGLVFVFLGYYFLVGRFIKKRHDKEKTLYVITDKRVVILKLEFLKK